MWPTWMSALGKPLAVTAPGRRAWLGWAGPLCSNCLLRLIAACKDGTVTTASTAPERVNEGSLENLHRLRPPSHKNTEASLWLSWITATLAANDSRRPTFSLLMFGVFTTEWVSGNLPRHLLRLCVSALEDNYRLRVNGGMDAHVGEPVRLFHGSLANPPLHHQIIPLKSHENIYIFQPCSTETSTATILEAPGVIRGAVWRHFVLLCFLNFFTYLLQGVQNIIA